MLRAGMPEEMIRRIAGWRKILDTYFRTLAAEDMAKTYKQMSPADKLWGSEPEPKRRQGPWKVKPKGKLSSASAVFTITISKTVRWRRICHC